MSLIDHFKDPNFWDIFFKDLMIGLFLVAILVVIFWLLDKLQKNKKHDLTARLSDQKLWKKRFKKIEPTETDEELEKALDYKINKWGF